MTNPTTPFSWQMPTSTDLVTDLPADFETFGQAVATSMADLLGGTTGQILSKASNTDMDFTWITNDQGDLTAITAGTGISVTSGTGPVPTVTNSMATEITAKGDLIVGTGSATFDNLAAGANGETLLADSTTTTGLRYSPTPSASNPVINSAMQIWQRTTTPATGIAGSTTGYCADRWQAYRAVAGSTFSRQVTGDTTNLPFIQFCTRVQRDSGNTAVNAIAFGQSFESLNSIPFAGKTVTLSFYGRKGANYSPTSSLLNVSLFTGTGTDQNILLGYTGASQIINQNATLTTTWQRFSYTATLAATATEMAINFQATPTGTAGANDYFEITGVQIDIGSVALPFRTLGATYQEEVSACQRYYYKSLINGTSTVSGTGFGKSTTVASGLITMPVSLRKIPTTVDFSNVGVFDGVTLTTATSVATNTTCPSTNDLIYVELTVASGLTQFRPYAVLAAGATGYIAFSAEI